MLSGVNPLNSPSRYTFAPAGVELTAIPPTLSNEAGAIEPEPGAADLTLRNEIMESCDVADGTTVFSQQD
jgi:hypothetical protein